MPPAVTGYTQRPDRKGTESSCKAIMRRFCRLVTLKDPIERGLKEKSEDSPSRDTITVTLKDPIERGLKGE